MKNQNHKLNEENEQREANWNRSGVKKDNMAESQETRIEDKVNTHTYSPKDTTLSRTLDSDWNIKDLNSARLMEHNHKDN